MLMFLGGESVYLHTCMSSSSYYLVASSELGGSLSLLETLTRIVFLGLVELPPVLYTMLEAWFRPTVMFIIVRDLNVEGGPGTMIFYRYLV